MGKNSKEHAHDVDQALMKRLRRVAGHLDSTIKMVENGRACTDVLQQLSAVIAALNGSRVLLLNNHMDKCLRPVLGAEHRGLVEELEVVLKQAMKG